METEDIVNWLEENIQFIVTCSKYISDVTIYNITVVNLGKKYHRIYIDIRSDLPKVEKPIKEMSKLEFEISFYTTIDRYITFRARHVDENIVKVHYDWISASCKIRLPEPPFNLTIKKYLDDTNKYIETI